MKMPLGVALPASKNRSRVWTLSRILLFLCCACGAPAREVPLTILHTTDIHGHILSTAQAEGKAVGGGLLRLASAVREVRAREQNVLLVDCGDLVQGSMASHLSGGLVMMHALEYLQYDAWVLGNHEWDWGAEKLGELVQSSGAPVLAGNVGVRPGEKALFGVLVKAFVIKEVDGIKVAIVGLTTPGMPSWFRPEYLGPMEFKGSVEALRDIMPFVREAKPDVMILAAHQGYLPFDDHANEINAIAGHFQEFDVILGGHTHQVIPEKRVGDALYAQAGSHAKVLGRVDLVYDTVSCTIKEKSAEAVVIGTVYDVDGALEDRLRPYLQAANRMGNEIVGRTEKDLTAEVDSRGRSDIQQLLCEAIAEASGAEVVLHNTLSEYGLPRGDIRVKDIWRIVPYENRVGLVSLTRGELEEILEENAGLRGRSHMMGAFGLAYDYDPGAKRGERVRNVRLSDGEVPHPRKRIMVALNSYVLASGGRRFNRLRTIVDRPTSRLELTGIDTREAVIKYVRKHSPIRRKDEPR